MTLRDVVPLRILTYLLALALIAAGFVVGVPTTVAQSNGGSYLVIAEGNNLPDSLADDVGTAGGELAKTIPELGIAVAAFASSEAAVDAEGIPGIRAVVPNLDLLWVARGYQEALTVNASSSQWQSGDEFLSELQWGHLAVDAAGAWAAGARGAGVRVAVLDAGFDLDHVDLYPNIDFSLSASFVPDEPLLYTRPDVFSHGTHTAGIVAAADNRFGLRGIAPEAELILVKVVRDDDSGEFAWLLEGLVHAAQSGADVITLGLTAPLSQNGFQDAERDRWVSATAVAELANAMSRATTYAYLNGATVIAAAGDYARDGGLGTDPDAGYDGDLIYLPAEAEHVLAVSATTPLGWAVGEAGTDLDSPTRYSNYGQSMVDLSAPGGDVVYAGDELCEVGPVVHDCFVFDLVLSAGSDWEPGYASYFWAGGTGAAAAYVSGVAALIIGASGGDLKPSLVEAALRASADDLGRPGLDNFYGYGRVNAGAHFR